MKKVLFTSILLLSAVSFGGNIYAHDAAGGNNTEVTTPSATQPSVKFTAATKPSVNFTADGNTLTISGQGDLTSYSTLEAVKVFTSDIENLRDAVWAEIKPGQEYNASAVYYYNNVKIDDNETFFAEHSSWVKDDTKSVSFADELAQTIAEGKFETVKFENTSSTDALKINNDIISKILFIEGMPSWNAFNSNLINLDLGQATCNDLSSETFSTTDKSGTEKLTTLTLPLTVKTTVKSESTSTMVEKMVLPSNVLSTYYPNITTVTIPEGYDRLGDKAFFERTKISTVNLPSTLTVIGNSAFHTCSALASIELNEGLENIGKEAFVGTALTSIKFPSSLKIINDAAFYECEISDLKFNEGLKFIGNSAFFLSAALPQTTLEIPVSVRYMGPFAFNNRQYQDVFFYGENAPLMPLGDSPYSQQCKNGTAFSANILMGNNGFNDGNSRKSDDLMDDARHDGYANRENYKNNGYYFVILHFPKGLNDAAKSKYTDITRRYETRQTEAGKFPFGKTEGVSSTYAEVGKEEKTFKWEGNPELVAAKNVCFGYQDTYLGKQYVWPSQEQWTRSFVVNSNGYNWDGITKYPSDEEIQNGYLSEDDIATLEYAGYKIGDGEGEYTKERLASIAHMGTRQFVLANADVNKDENEEKEPEYEIVMKPGQWWTLCVPFNMTRKQVLETFGSDTQLCLFYQVERHTTNGQNSILLKFTKDALNNSSTDDEGKKMKGTDGRWNYDGFEHIENDDEVVVWAHESYMIKPMNGQDSDKDAVFVVKKFTPIVGNPLPTVVDATGTDQLQDDDYSKEYRFVGNYLGNTVIPKYSYIYASTKSDPAYKFRFYTGTKATWSPNKSIVQSHDRQGGLLDYKNFFGSDKSTMPQSAKQASIFGEEGLGEITGIDNVTIIAGSDVLTPIYTLDGKMVSANGSVDGLAKGVYVKAGKKFIVK